MAVEIARGGEIGKPRVFSSTFSMQVREGNTRVQPRREPRRGAGPVYDIGIVIVTSDRPKVHEIMGRTPEPADLY